MEPERVLMAAMLWDRTVAELKDSIQRAETVASDQREHVDVDYPFELNVTCDALSQAVGGMEVDIIDDFPNSGWRSLLYLLPAEAWRAVASWNGSPTIPSAFQDFGSLLSKIDRLQFVVRRIRMLTAAKVLEPDEEQEPDSEQERTVPVGKAHEICGVKSKTFNKYARAADVKPPDRGKRDHRYTMTEVRAVLCQIVANGGSEQARQHAKKALAAFPRNRH